MKRHLKRISLSVVSIIVLVLSIMYFTSITVHSADRDEALTREYYSGMEKEYRKELRNELENAGLKNSGITMTKVIRENGERIYSVSIHNEKWDRMPEDEKEELTVRVSALRLPVDDTEITCYFNENLSE